MDGWTDDWVIHGGILMWVGGRVDEWMEECWGGWTNVGGDGRSMKVAHLNWLDGWASMKADLVTASKGEVCEAGKAVQQGHAAVPHSRAAHQGQVAQPCQGTQLLQSSCGDCAAVGQDQLLQAPEGCNALQGLQLAHNTVRLIV